jgi:hypothetical protein
VNGLDLDNIEVTTREEIAAFRGQSLDSTGGRLMHPLPAYSVLLENRPDMLKLHLRQAREIHVIPGEGRYRALTAVAMLHWYACNRYPEGIIHEIRTLQGEGATKAQINEILAIAFLHSGPSGMRFVYDAAFDYLLTYQEPSQPVAFPSGWSGDPGALKSGIDLSSPELSHADREALFGWYERTLGEVPRSISFLAGHDPRFLKAQRAKLEATMRGALPKQMLPYILLHHNVNRGFAGGIREATLLGRAWGMTKAQVMHAITFAASAVAGTDALYVVDDAVGELLAGWQ